MKRQKLEETLKTSQRIDVFYKKTHSLLYIFEKTANNGNRPSDWKAETYAGKLEFPQPISEQEVLTNLKTMQKYSYFIFL